jgi:hypothetical protein
VTYAPDGLGEDLGCLEIWSDDPDENPAILNLSGTGVAVPPIDLDIVSFRATKRFSLTKGQDTIKITLTVKNDGAFNSQTRPATITGEQAGTPVFSTTIDVDDAVGDGQSKFEVFYTPGGELVADVNIDWKATIADNDPDIDEATATTSVVP